MILFVYLEYKNNQCGTKTFLCNVYFLPKNLVGTNTGQSGLIRDSWCFLKKIGVPYYPAVLFNKDRNFGKIRWLHKGYFLSTLEMRGFHMVYLELLFKIYQIKFSVFHVVHMSNLIFYSRRFHMGIIQFEGFFKKSLLANNQIILKFYKL